MMRPIMRADIRSILQAFEQSGFASLDLSYGSVSVAASRAGLGSAHEPDVDLADATVVKAPMLGILQAGPAAGAAPFVLVGSVVDPDTVVAALRVLDKTTEVEAGVRGTVIAMPVRDGELVEYGQPVVYVRESAS